MPFKNTDKISIVTESPFHKIEWPPLELRAGHHLNEKQ